MQRLVKVVSTMETDILSITKAVLFTIQVLTLLICASDCYGYNNWNNRITAIGTLVWH